MIGTPRWTNGARDVNWDDRLVPISINSSWYLSWLVQFLYPCHHDRSHPYHHNTQSIPSWSIQFASSWSIQSSSPIPFHDRYHCDPIYTLMTCLVYTIMIHNRYHRIGSICTSWLILIYVPSSPFSEWYYSSVSPWCRVSAIDRYSHPHWDWSWCWGHRWGLSWWVKMQTGSSMNLILWSIIKV